MMIFIPKRKIDEAIETINRFLPGDTDARIESDGEGSLNKLFHAINTLATTLNAHAKREQDAKLFLRDTISDISHQLKTPLTSMNLIASFLRQRDLGQERRLELSRELESLLQRIDWLITTLLRISKIDTGTVCSL